MNEWFKKTFGTIKEKWGKWSLVQKIILIGVIVVVIAAIIILLSVSSNKASVRLFNSPVEASQQRTIISRLQRDGINADVDSEGYVTVENNDIAKKYRSQLVSEGYLPKDTDPWSLFDTQKWSRTSFDDKVNWKRATEAQVAQHLEQLDGIRLASVILTLPEETAFANDQNPTTASVVLFPKQGSDVLTSRSKVQGIQHLVELSVEGLTADNITILNGDTNEEINDFDSLEAADKINNLDKQQKLIRKLESEYSAAVLKSLQYTFGDNRVRIANMKIDMDMSERESTGKKYTGINIKEDNPNTVYDDSITVESLKLSEETVKKSQTGTGYNPEGPAGIEGQNPPVYSDMSNVIGKTEEEGAKINYALNEENYTETKSPTIDRVTVSVNIDGTWDYPLYDENGKIRRSISGGYERNYVPISEEELGKVERLVRNAVGYDASRGDSVEVTNIQFDRTEQFREEDARLIKSENTRRTVMFVLIGIAIVLVLFIVFRLISKEIERRKRLREEELLRRQQQEREQALWDAKEQGMEVTLSVEERRRAELQENAIAMAKEHPEDVAMLIRTWLMEE
ncbi:MAG: flagellar M-ring protein FliF [Treponema sp.]|nr:flagellar M-ring protein FliF [Treponema sp.]MBR7080412.1 flagellar M-ring protein FliF [Treponema sp.]